MTTTATPTLADFLLARIEGDEAAARAAASIAASPWRATYGRQVETNEPGYLVTPEDEHAYTADPPDGVGVHIALHDPARVLAECAAKRAILERCRGLMLDEGDPAPSVYDVEAHLDGLAYDVLTALAQSYASHPDFRAEWSA